MSVNVCQNKIKMKHVYIEKVVFSDLFVDDFDQGVTELQHLKHLLLEHLVLALHRHLLLHRLQALNRNTRKR